MSTPQSVTKIKYLTNKDLLEEIHKSKKSYSVYLDDCYSNYDIIGTDLAVITDEVLEAARHKRVTDTISKMSKELTAQGKKGAVVEFTLDDVPRDKIVVRVMTWDHIPLDPIKGIKGKTESERHLRIPFPPYQHWVKDEVGEWRCVGKSHWCGGIENGHFSCTHGKMTNRLALMFMKLTERYGRRGNWRSYCVDTKTQALTHRGWVNIDTILESDTIMSYTNRQMKWSAIKSIYRGQYNGNMHKLTNANIDALITPDHKMVTDRGLIPIGSINKNDQMVLMGYELASNTELHSNSLIELLGWVTVDSVYQVTDRNTLQITVCQINQTNANRIRRCLIDIGCDYSEIKHADYTKFTINEPLSQHIYKLAPDMIPTTDLILELSSAQRHLLIDVLVDGNIDQRTYNRQYTHANRDNVDMFQMLCATAGIKTTSMSIKQCRLFGKSSNYYQVALSNLVDNVITVASINFHGGQSSALHTKNDTDNTPTIPYDGQVWCPETEYGCFLARRNGKVYLTGNTYNEDMRAQALAQLAAVGLKFDESRSDNPNPFAYYTAIVTSSFTRILNVEKRSQTIRDDLLIMAGATPSFSRQIDDSIKQQNDAKDPPT